MMARLSLTTCLCLALCCGVAKAQPTMGIGVLCSYALVVGLRSYQKQCQPTREDEAKFLDPLIKSHRWYVAQNGDWKAADHTAFEKKQAGTVSDCTRDDLNEMLNTMLADPKRLTQEIEFQLSKGRTPEWGVCF